MVVMDMVNANLGLENSGRWSLYTGGLYIQLNYSEKCIGRTQRRSLYAGGLFMQVVFSTGSTVLQSSVTKNPCITPCMIFFFVVVVVVVAGMSLRLTVFKAS